MRATGNLHFGGGGLNFRKQDPFSNNDLIFLQPLIRVANGLANFPQGNSFDRHVCVKRTRT